MMERLKPHPRDVERLARRECMPEHATQYEAVTLGPFANAALLALVAAAALIVTPFRLLLSLLRTPGRS
jgi:hypothetical protein